MIFKIRKCFCISPLAYELFIGIDEDENGCLYEYYVHQFVILFFIGYRIETRNGKIVNYGFVF